MTSIHSRTQPGACQADRRCQRAPCFQARLEAGDGPQRVSRSAEACASHFGDMVQALAAWAYAHDLTDGQLTVLAIDPPPAGPCPGARVGLRERAGHGFAFSTIELAP